MIVVAPKSFHAEQPVYLVRGPLQLVQISLDVRTSYPWCYYVCGPDRQVQLWRGQALGERVGIARSLSRERGRASARRGRRTAARRGVGDPVPGRRRPEENASLVVYAWNNAGKGLRLLGIDWK